MHKRLPPTKPVTATLAINTVEAVCPGGSRPGLDGVITAVMKDIDCLVRDMRVGIPVPVVIVDEGSAVKRYLVYLSMLVDVTLADIAMSAIHINDLAVLMKARMLVEYLSKAIYCDAHPDYALKLTTIEEAESVYKKIRNGGRPAQDVAAALAEVERRKVEFAQVAHLPRVDLSQMMREQTRPGDHTRNDEYVWLYGTPSAIMHGDPEGMRKLLPIDKDGTQRGEIDLEDDHLNALMVDATANTLHFCRVFVGRFHPGSKDFQQRIDAIDTDVKRLVLKHAVRRDEKVLDDIRKDLESKTR